MHVAIFQRDIVSVIDTNTNALVGSPIAVGNGPFGIAIDATHERMYVAYQGGGGTGAISVIDTNGNIRLRSLQ
jgi:YVTN family beta-propeller protein